MFWICFSPGVSVLAVGVYNADIEELNKIAAPTTYKNIFYSPTFDDFPSIEREFINSICSEELLSEFKLHDEAREKTLLLHLDMLDICDIFKQYFFLVSISVCSVGHPDWRPRGAG